MKKRLYLVIENYNRELESRIYLAVRAAELGWSVVIGNKTNIVKQIKNLHSGVFFIKSIGPKNAEIINLLKEYSNKIVATDEENIVFFDDNHLLTRMNHNCLSEIDSFYCWGQREFEYLERLYPKFKNKFFITGNPRIDILKAPLNKKYIKEASILKKKIGKFILINSGFGKVIRASKTDWVEDAINAGKLDTEDKIENEKRAVNYERLNLNGFVELVNFLTDKLPFTKFILRPHPAEDPDWWRKTFKNIKNLDINVEKISTNVFIGASEFLIAHNCITLLEAYFLNKRSINFICHKDKRYEHELISKCSQIINDKEKILNFINTDIKNGVSSTSGLNNRRINAFTVPIVVKIMNNISSNYTVIEVSGKDRPSILYELAKTINHLNLNLFRAQVATFGERVVDVFYVLDSKNRKIEHHNSKKLIERELLRVLSNG